MSGSGASRGSLHAGTLLAVYLLGGGILGSLAGALAAPHHELYPVETEYRRLATASDHPSDDNDTVVAWPLLGLSVGIVAGISASRLHLAVRRARRGYPDGSGRS